MQRKGSNNGQFNQRIPADVKARAVGLTLQIPLGNDVVPVTISTGTNAIRLSLRTFVPSEVKIRQAAVAGYLEGVWQSLRKPEPEILSHQQIVAMSRAVYDWTSLAEDDPEFADAESARGTEGGPYAATLAVFDAGKDPMGRTAEEQAAILADKILVRHGKLKVAEVSRDLLTKEVLRSLRQGWQQADQRTLGDYSPDPNLARFPPLDLSPSKPAREAHQHVSLTGLVEDWWKEAKAAGRTVSTYETYKSAVHRLADFLKHDNAEAVKKADIVAFKDHRLAQGASPKTVGDNDIAALRSVFKWAVSNLKLPANPAEGVSVTRQKVARNRAKSFTAEEATALLAQSYHYAATGRESAKLSAAKRWAPWLCAYTGARLGEIVQLRKQDVRQEGENWVITITPEAGTVKDKEVREVVLHRHLIEQGFPTFVEGSAKGYLFLTPRADGEVRGVWRSVKNRLREFAREVVKDAEVAPNHGWRHLFKTIGREAGIADSVLDAICGHAAKTVGGAYGGVTLKAQLEAMAKFPRFAIKLVDIG